MIIKRKRLNKENILKEITEYDIFAYYLGQFKPGETIINKVRGERHKSLRIFNKNNTLIYYDHATGEGGDCFLFLKRALNADSFRSVYQEIDRIFNLGFGEYTTPVEKAKRYGPIDYQAFDDQQKIVKYQTRKWTKKDVDYWASFHIPIELLEQFDVAPISYFWINGDRYSAEEHAYRYRLLNNRVKIYQPFSDFKWVSGITKVPFGQEIQGLAQLELGGELFVKSKSLKDIMKLYQYGYPAISTGGEGHVLSDELLTKVKSSFNRHLIWYDNDAAGIKLANKHSEHYQIPFVHNPIGEPKDISDYAKAYGDVAAYDLTLMLLEQNQYAERREYRE